MKVQIEDKYFHYGYHKPIRYYWLKKMLYPIMNLFFHLLTTFIPRDHRKTKHFFSLVLIFKDEAPYLREWIEYHLLLGADHFYLYQNNSTDNYLSVIQPYIEKELITLVEWPEYPGQYSAYLNWYKTFRNETRWVSFIDIDEFICPISDTTLQEVMSRYEKYPVVLTYWKLFGTNGNLMHNTGIPVIEQYTNCRPKLFTEGKIIYNTYFDAASEFISMHYLEIKWHCIKIPPVNTFKKFIIWELHRVNKKNQPYIQLNHYWSKAFECWKKKYEKGSIEKGIKYKDFDFFKRLEFACTSTDHTIWRFLTLLKLRLKE